MSNQLLKNVNAFKPLMTTNPALASNILFATDFSEGSVDAFQYVATVAGYYNSKVHVVHIVGSGMFPLLPQQVQDGMVHDAELKMREFLKRTPKCSSDFHQIIAGGEPSEIICNLGKELDIDLLVLGTHGRRGLKRFVLGSVAEEIFRRAPCPVLTIGPKTQPQVPVGGKLRKILFATDLDPASLEALPYAAKLAKDCQASLILLHVAATQAKTEDARHRLAAVASEQDPALKMDLRLVVGAPAPTIVRVAANYPADLLIMGVRGGGNWDRAATHAPGPVAYNVIAQAPCPVLTLRSQAASGSASNQPQ